MNGPVKNKNHEKHKQFDPIIFNPITTVDNFIVWSENKYWVSRFNRIQSIEGNQKNNNKTS